MIQNEIHKELLMSLTIDLTGQKAIVTGGRKGIGKAMATAFAKAGAEVIITTRSSPKLTDKELANFDTPVHTFVLDVQDKNSIDECFNRIHQEVGEIDILVNNAGIEQVCPSKEVDETIWDMIINTNLKGAFFCSRAFANLPYSKSSRTILNLCSLTSSIGIPTAVPYTSSKSGLAGMTKALASEWANEGIRVNGIAPGYFYTDMTAGFYEDKAWQEKCLALFLWDALVI